jgi:hypothetical protein
MITVAFDGVCLADGPVTGVGRCFLSALAAYAQNEQANCLLLLPKDVTPPSIPGIQVIESPSGMLARQRRLPAILKSRKPSVFHSSVASVPLRAPCPTIATAHDLPWLHPELKERSSRWRRIATRLALRSATQIIVPSSMTRDDVRQLLGDACPTIACVMHGSQTSSAPSEQSTQQRSDPFLVIGDDRERKNHDRLRAAHRIATKQAEDLPPLQFIGPPDNYVNESKKLALLGSCRAVVHVSTFEGFGMPVLEALAHGSPVVCSDLPPHREIAKEHALYVDPFAVSSIAEGLLRIHKDTALRSLLASGGHQRAKQLQPSDTASQWARIHKEVLK